MIVVRVELHSAITGRITELARAHICNIGGTATKGNYSVSTLRGRDKEAFDRRVVQRSGEVRDYPRLSVHVWHLVARALIAMGYAGKAEQAQQSDLERAG
ncbi:hypothetical protein [Bradyrhizobium cenepequi]|uniref:hypothetical protein n=1 Tax=Bradyrhizobium cenepequi TaxID=2821403 RepID=UPI001CE3299B|nr:hypothetical protein [Bradyrhizobium cenepequi]MCA6108120.1 hypothetical protein [Bradyrhizobium cenepequi]